MITRSEQARPRANEPFSVQLRQSYSDFGYRTKRKQEPRLIQVVSQTIARIQDMA